MSDGNVNSIGDHELLRRAVQTARGKRSGPRWAAVSERFLLGSTYSRQLCERFDFDPEERVLP